MNEVKLNKISSIKYLKAADYKKDMNYDDRILPFGFSMGLGCRRLVRNFCKSITKQLCFLAFIYTSGIVSLQFHILLNTGAKTIVIFVSFF